VQKNFTVRRRFIEPAPIWPFLESVLMIYSTMGSFWCFCVYRLLLSAAVDFIPLKLNFYSLARSHQVAIRGSGGTAFVSFYWEFCFWIISS